mmetsp:Transcript_11323/g.39444  ORF Transcript_11323/g.39444 Transcript_11323/m.39444 type:complete len:324 (-) Transcript_11323:51-1022(-)
MAAAVRSQRLVALGCGGVLALTGAVCLMVASQRLGSLPAATVCTTQGYAASDCTSPNQTIFSNKFDPPCCLGARNESEAWGGWQKEMFDELAIELDHVSCDDIAASLRAGLPKTRPLPPGQTYEVAVLDQYEDIAKDACIKSRVESGYYFLELSGPLVLVAALAAVAVVLRESQAGVTAAGVLLAASVAACSVAIHILLHMRATQFGYERRILCSSLPQRYVVGGVYLGTFVCADVTVGGEMKLSPTYAYLNEAMAIFIAGAVFGVVALVVLAVLVGGVAARPSKRRVSGGNGRDDADFGQGTGATLLGAAAAGGSSRGYRYR